MTRLPWSYSDGGRAAAGYRGAAGDCVARAISILTGTPYDEVYADLADRQAAIGHERSARNGINRTVWRRYMHELGWIWTPTMRIGGGCQVHLAAGELPMGRLLVQVTKHVCAVIDGVIYDNHDPTRNGSRCVYGYFKEPA